VRNYALAYPAQVAGMVLVDVVKEDQRIPMGPKKVGRVGDSARGTPTPNDHRAMRNNGIALASSGVPLPVSGTPFQLLSPGHW
jgi:hypothetical protein